MAKTGLTNVRIRIVDGDIPKVFVAYEYTTSDDEPMSKSRDVWDNLTPQQRTGVTNFIGTIKQRISTVEGVA